MLPEVFCIWSTEIAICCENCPDVVGPANERRSPAENDELEVATCDHRSAHTAGLVPVGSTGPICVAVMNSNIPFAGGCGSAYEVEGDGLKYLAGISIAPVLVPSKSLPFHKIGPQGGLGVGVLPSATTSQNAPHSRTSLVAFT